MKLPDLIPDAFLQYEQCESDDELFAALVREPSLLVDFFYSASDDHTWSTRDHPQFTKKALSWFERECLDNNLAMPFIFKVADAIQNNSLALKPLIDRRVGVKLTDGELFTSAILMIASSDSFRELLRSTPKKEKAITIELKMNAHFFNIVDEYLLHGEGVELWKEEPEALEKVMGLARRWELEELALQAEEILIRYLTRDNVFDRLGEAQKRKWPVLRQGCIDLLNQMKLGIILRAGGLNMLACRFEDLKVHTIDAYKKIKKSVTSLEFVGNQSEKQMFIELIEMTPNLQGLNLGDTDSHLEIFKKLPPNVTQLRLNHCSWINAQALSLFAEVFPKLTHLELVSNPHLGSLAFGMLQQFPELTYLNVARCDLDDDAFKVICAAAARLETINVEGSGDITPFGFTELARISPGLRYIYAGKTQISDGSIIEIAQNCLKLRYLNVAQCRNVTYKGLEELVRLRSSLKTLVVKGCNLSDSEFTALKKERAQLTIIR